MDTEPEVTDTIPPGGANTWLSVRVHVPNGDCPAAQPVLFVVNFHREWGDEQANVGGFHDLGTVPYPTCT
ncbi:MAG: hypothetical protein QOH97_4280 [Actinoplanes sp.]|jgi:hypothetical protein|nr:hypothetical protein [Actinoplanes sp.]